MNRILPSTGHELPRPDVTPGIGRVLPTGGIGPALPTGIGSSAREQTLPTVPAEATGRGIGIQLAPIASSSESSCVKSLGGLKSHKLLENTGILEKSGLLDKLKQYVGERTHVGPLKRYEASFYFTEKEHDVVCNLIRDNPSYAKHIVVIVGQDLARTERYAYEGPVNKGLIDHLESKLV